MPSGGDGSFNERMKKKLLGGNKVWAASSRPISAPFTPPNKRTAQPTLHSVQIPSPLAQGEEGVVWTEWPESAFPAPEQFIGSTPPIDYIGLNGALLFSDRFELPTNSAMGFSSPIRDHLRKHGLLSESFCAYSGDVAGAIRRSCFDTFLARSKEEPGRWAIGRGAQSLCLPSEELTSQQGFSILLRNALPIFTEAVQLDQILEFKARRRDELISLRDHMKGLCRRIGNEGVEGLANSAELEEFDRSLADHMRVMGESNLEKAISSFRASVSWDATIPVGFEVALEHTMTSAGVLSAGAVMLLNTVRGLKRVKSLSPFEYLTTVNRELG